MLPRRLCATKSLSFERSVSLAAVTFVGAGKVYPDGTRALEDLDLSIEDGEFMVLVGPSGCGKTTALRMVAGLEEVSEGEILIGERVVNDLEPRQRDVAMVFQNYALYPHMSVYDNIAFGLENRRVPKAEIKQRVQRISGVLGLSDLLHRKPRALSGGQRQRVAMGRAIVRDPRVFLMDEPLSNLDAKLRVQMRGEVARIQRELGATTIYVTHDQVEAMTMGERVAVLRKGELQQVDLPKRLYDSPVNLFVATFIGSPAMNLLKARLERENGTFVCRIGDQRLPLAADLNPAPPALDGFVGHEVAVGIRPESAKDPAADRPADRRLRGELVLVEELGFETLVHLELPAEPVLTEEVLEVARDIDQAFAQDLATEARKRRAPFVARLDTRFEGAPGREVEVAVDCTKLHLFDLDTGLAINTG